MKKLNSQKNGANCRENIVNIIKNITREKGRKEHDNRLYMQTLYNRA